MLLACTHVHTVYVYIDDESYEYIAHIPLSLSLSLARSLFLSGDSPTYLGIDASQLHVLPDALLQIVNVPPAFVCARV